MNENGRVFPRLTKLLLLDRKVFEEHLKSMKKAGVFPAFFEIRSQFLNY